MALWLSGHSCKGRMPNKGTKKDTTLQVVSSLSILAEAERFELSHQVFPI